jgi:hypothetical protein
MKCIVKYDDDFPRLAHHFDCTVGGSEVRALPENTVRYPQRYCQGVEKSATSGRQIK